MSTASLQELGRAQSTLVPSLAQSMARRVREELGRSSYSTVRRLTCECRNNVLTIMGRVPMFYQIQVAISLAMLVVRDEVAIRHEIEVTSEVWRAGRGKFISRPPAPEIRRYT
ncbi:MAG: hypothetical protein AB7O59_08260 [Pirellulales bacterium]